MSLRLVVAVVCLWAAPAWAGEHRVAVAQRTDFSALTSEAFALVPSLTGGHEEVPDGLVVFDKAGGEFTDAEKALLNQAVAAHDPAIRAKRQAQERKEEQDIPLDDFGAGAAGALAVLAGRGLVIRARKKTPPA